MIWEQRGRRFESVRPDQKFRQSNREVSCRGKWRSSQLRFFISKNETTGCFCSALRALNSSLLLDLRFDDQRILNRSYFSKFKHKALFDIFSRCDEFAAYFTRCSICPLGHGMLVQRIIVANENILGEIFSWTKFLNFAVSSLDFLSNRFGNAASLGNRGYSPNTRCSICYNKNRRFLHPFTTQQG